MKRIYLSAVFLALFLPCLMVDTLHAAVVYPLEVFTDNGCYHDSPHIHLYVEVVDRESRVDFIFHNESLIDCSIARIYFQGGSFFGIADIIDGHGTSFGHLANPAHLPAGNLLEPPFVTTHELSFDSDPPAPQNGINPGEWVQIAFTLINNGTFQGVIDGFNTGNLRTGAHIIALPDGSSESAIAVPEPTMLCLLGLGSIAFLRIRKR